MTFTVTIPVDSILTFIYFYVFVGLVLYTPLLLWSNRFVSGDRQVSLADYNIKRVLKSMVLWPVLTVACAVTEIRYRRKGYL
jgi:hypothetical protein